MPGAGTVLHARTCVGATPRGVLLVGGSSGLVCIIARGARRVVARSAIRSRHFCAASVHSFAHHGVLSHDVQKGAHAKGGYIGHCVGTVSWGKLREKHPCLIICMGNAGNTMSVYHLDTSVHSPCTLRVPGYGYPDMHILCIILMRSIHTFAYQVSK